MALWRQTITAITFATLLSILSGCAPASSSLQDEEKELNFVRGMNREAALDYSGAAESYQRALDANPHSSMAHFRLAFLYVRQNNDPAAAIYHFQQFLKLRPNSEHANVIRQHIIGCKQELAKEFALGPVGDEVKVQLDQLIQETQQLKEENQRLSEENRRLREQLSLIQTGQPLRDTQPATTPSIGGTASRSPTQSTPPSSSRTYTIQKGDTYYSIAKRYNIKPSALEAANPGINPSRLNVGGTLVVPGP